MADGELWIEPGAAERCAAICERLAEGLSDDRQSIIQLNQLPSFGGFPSGPELRSGFATKTTAAAEHLDEHIAIARNMAAVFRRMGAAYSQTEHATVTSLGRAGEGLDPSKSSMGDGSR